MGWWRKSTLLIHFISKTSGTAAKNEPLQYIDVLIYIFFIFKSHTSSFIPVASGKEEERTYNEMQQINEFSRLGAEYGTKANECLLKAYRPTLRTF